MSAGDCPVNRTTQLDGEITDAAPGIELTRSGKGVRWTGIKAGGAGAAVIGLVSWIRLQIDVQQESADEKITAQPLVEQHGILAEPTKTRPPCEVTLEKGCRVNHPAAMTIRNFFLDHGQKLIEAPAENVVVILSQGIASHFTDLNSAPCPLTPIPGLVVHADHDDAAHLGQDRGRMTAGLAVAVHVVHRAGEAVL